MRRCWGVLLSVLFAACAMTGVALGAEAEVADSSPWLPVVGNLVLLILEIAAPVLLVLGGYAGVKLAQKLGMENKKVVRDALREAVAHGVSRAELWAKEQSEKPTGENKKAKAVIVALEFLDNDGIKNIAREKLEAYIDEKFGQIAFEERAAEKTATNGSSS